MEISQLLAHTIEREINWLQQVIDTSLTLYFKNESSIESVYLHQPPDLLLDQSPYSQFVLENQLSFEERLVLILALVPFVKPQVLDVFLIKNQNLNCDFSEFGGVKEHNKKGFVPTLETASFILGNQALDLRFEFFSKFNSQNILFRHGVLEVDIDKEFEHDQELKISKEYFGLFTTGKKSLPQFGAKFPAKEITTNLDWDDLVVDQNVLDDLTEIKDWLLHSDTILSDWQMSKNLKSGYRVLFYGSPGTGKTLAASLLGKSTGKPVFRVDLSLVVSKYIGETEKNLGKLFDEAENKDWILFFDEADALFGKRTSTKGANDRYANQEVAYLLQRIEDFDGLVVLATNIQSNIDEAFSRRFQTIVNFPRPGKKQRQRLWENLFQNDFELESSIQIADLADKYDLSGGEMINVLRYCSLEAAKRGKKEILLNDIVSGVKREYVKLNKTI